MPLRALAIGLLFAIPLADSVYRIPVQASEVADIVQYVGDTADLGSAFTLGLRASPTMLRPMRQLHTKLLLKFAAWRGRGFHTVFRGFHAGLGVLLVLAFVAAARPASFVDLSALACALAVLVGFPTFTGLFREAYPVNHFLVVALYGWVVLLVAQHGRGILADVVGTACVALALLTLESGVLVALVALVAHLSGWRGISRRGLAFIAVVLLAYAFLRVGYLGIQAPPFAERDTGFGLGVLSTSEQMARFGKTRWQLYAYNIVSGVSAILTSQPANGTWTLLAAWRADEVRPWMVVQVVATIAATLVITWYAARRNADGRRGWRDPYCLVAGAMIVANAVLGYAYAKDEIIAFAGTFYALAFFAAARSLLSHLSVARRSALGTTVACALMMLWATRVAASHVILREQAFFVRNDWVERAEQASVTRTLRLEALSVPTIAPRSLPAWVPAWVGER